MEHKEAINDRRIMIYWLNECEVKKLNIMKKMIILNNNWNLIISLISELIKRQIKQYDTQKSKMR